MAAAKGLLTHAVQQIQPSDSRTEVQERSDATTSETLIEIWQADAQGFYVWTAYEVRIRLVIEPFSLL
jgi:hypothetical protein